MSPCPVSASSPLAPRRLSNVPGQGKLSSIRELAAAYDNDVSPMAIVDECLARIEEGNGRIRALIAVDADGARAAAQQLEGELRAGHRRGPLHAVPVVIKDMFDLSGWPTTAGSRLFAGHVATRDAAAVMNLKAAGAIILGKANQHELCIGGHDNPWFGRVTNPLDDSRGTGGSSSGSVAAVAAGFCIAALGTDTGGSNRSPAAAAGLVGVKPSHGLIDVTGSLPTAHSLDSIGSFTTTVADARLMTAALAGRTAPAKILRRPSEIVVATCPKLYDAPVDPAVAARHHTWFDALRRAGVRIVEIDFDGAPLREAAVKIMTFEFAAFYGDRIAAHPERVGSSARSFAETARATSRETYERACRVRDDVRTQFLARMEGCDVIVAPVAPGLAPRFADDCTRVGDAYVSYSGAGAKFRLWANALDMPVIAVPLACDEGLPASIQIAARTGQDWQLFDLAEALTTVPQ